MTIGIIGAFVAAVSSVAFLLFHPTFVNNLEFMKGLPVLSKVFVLLKVMNNHAQLVLRVKGEVIALTLVGWFFKGAEWLVIAKSLGISFGDSLVYELFLMMAINASITLLQFIPIPSAAGAGVSEAGVVGIFYLFGIDPGVAVSFGILTRLVMIVQDVFGMWSITEYLKSHEFSNLVRRITEFRF